MQTRTVATHERTSIAETLAAFAVSYVPTPTARDAIAKSVVDAVGCVLAATSEPVSAATRHAFSAPEGPAPVIGTDDRAHPADAALIMGTTAHALDLDDFDVRSGGHPAVAIVPAAFYACFADEIESADVLAAIGAGYEVMALLGLAIHKQAKRRGQHGTGVFGAVAAAVAAGRIHNLDVASMRHAIGLAVGQAAGMRANFGTMAKPLQAGNAARAGVTAALLARHGATGGQDPIAGPGGLVQSAVGPDDREEARERMVELAPRLGSLLDELPPSLKRHASCGSTHASIDAALALRDEVGPADGIATIEVTVPPVYLESLFYSRPVNGLEAKFSLEHCVAVALVHGDANRRRFLHGGFGDPEVMRLRERVVVVPDPELEVMRDTLKCLPARVRITSATGEHRRDVVDAVGTSRHPMDWEQVEHKLADNAPALDERRRTEIIRLVRHLTGRADISAVSRIASA